MSEKVVKLVKEGRTESLLQAIYNERGDKNSPTGKSNDGSVEVRRIGSYAPAIVKS